MAAKADKPPNPGFPGPTFNGPDSWATPTTFGGQRGEPRMKTLTSLGKSLMGMAALAASGLGLSTTSAAAETTWTGNVALATDYAFRGVSQTDGAAAVSGGFDVSVDSFYAGVWASNVDFTGFGVDGGLELDIYGGFKVPLDTVTLDFGLIGYFYPNSSDLPGPLPNVEGELDYLEAYAKGSLQVAENVALGAALYYSPEFTGETGQALYAEIGGSVNASDTVSFSGALGYQSIDDVSGVFAGSFSDEYLTWNVGGTLALEGFAIDLRYVGTDIEKNDDIIVQAFTTEGRVDDRVILSVKRSF